MDPNAVQGSFSGSASFSGDVDGPAAIATTFAGTGSFAASGAGIGALSTTFAGSAAFTGLAEGSAFITGSFAGSASFSAAGAGIALLTGTFSGTGSFSAGATIVAQITTTFAGSAAVSGDIINSSNITGSFLGSGDFSASGSGILSATGTFFGTGSIAGSIIDSNAIAGSFSGSAALTGAITNGAGGTPLPTDVLSGVVQSYIFRDGYLTYNAGDITACENQANPGTHDLSATSPGSYVASGLDGQDCVELSGAEYYDAAGTLPYLQGESKSLYIVYEFNGTLPYSGNDYLYRFGGGDHYMRFTNGNSGVSTRFDGVTTGVCSLPSSDLTVDTPYLFGHVSYEDDGELWLNGTLDNNEGTTHGGIEADETSFRLGDETGSPNVRIGEIVVVRDDGSDAERVDYEYNRVGVDYPTIGAALP